MTDVRTYRNAAGVADAVYARAKQSCILRNDSGAKELKAARMGETLVYCASEVVDAHIGRIDRRRATISVLSPLGLLCSVRSQLPKMPAAAS